MVFGLRLCHSWDIDCGLCLETRKINVVAHETDTERTREFLEEFLEHLSESSLPESAGKEFAVEQ